MDNNRHIPYHRTILRSKQQPLACSTPNFKSKSGSLRPRPTPVFHEKEAEVFTFKKDSILHKNIHPKSPIKSAPPVSRIFPRRHLGSVKAHAVSFREKEDLKSILNSPLYNSCSSELYFEQCFVIERKLGEGSFGEVMQVKSKEDGQKFAVKRSREKFRSEADRRRKLDEVKKHEELPIHPNCVKFIKAWEERQRLYIQTELCVMSLHTFLEKHDVPMYVVWSILVDMLHGLNHIHQHGFIHFDVKPANIFLTRNGTYKLGDFGLVFDSMQDNMIDASEGDNKYMAQELLNGIFTNKADVFSLGITMLEIASGLNLPPSGAAWHLLRQGYIPPECLSKLPSDLLVLIQWMMTPNYMKRPTIMDVMNHSIIRNAKRKLWSSKVLEACYLSVAQVCTSICLALYNVYNYFVPQTDTDEITQTDIQVWNDKETSGCLFDTSGYCDVFSESDRTGSFVLNNSYSHDKLSATFSEGVDGQSCSLPSDFSPGARKSGRISLNNSFNNSFDTFFGTPTKLNFKDDEDDDLQLYDSDDENDGVYKMSNQSHKAFVRTNLISALNEISDLSSDET